jgi:O-antigen/teichoic acid export membrane protein
MHTAAAHNWHNLVLDAPHLVIPILATALVSATAGGSFYAAWTILAFGYVVPFHLGTVLYAFGAGNQQAVQRELRFTLRLSLLLGLIGVPALLFGAPLVLGLFGPTYAELATFPLQLLALGYFPMVVLAHFVAVCRIRDRIKLAAVVVTVFGVVEIGAAATGAIVGGLVGLSVGVLAAKCLQGVCTASTVVRAVTAGLPPTEASETEAPAGITSEEVQR